MKEVGKFLYEKETQEYGRGLYSKNEILPGYLRITSGTRLLYGPPFAAVVNSADLMKFCSSCFKYSNQLKTCGSCKIICYCSDECQKDDWYFHKEECIVVKKSKYVIPSFFRLVFRILIKRKKEDCEVFTEFDPKSPKDLTEKTQEEFAMLMMFFKNVSPGILPSNLYEIFQLLIKIKRNAFAIFNQDFVTIGAGIYYPASLINHSCSPNAAFCFDGNNVRIVAIKPIPANEQVFLSYIETINSRANRLSELEDSYFFKCKCEMCSNDEVNFLLEALKCVHCSQLLSPPASGKNSVQCSKCNKVTMTETTSDKLIQQSMKEPNPERKFELATQALKIRSKYMNPYHHLLFNNRQHLLSICFSTEHYETALALLIGSDFNDCIVATLDRFHTKLFPFNCEMWYIASAIALNLEKLSVAKFCLGKALEIAVKLYPKSNNRLKEMKKTMRKIEFSLAFPKNAFLIPTADPVKKKTINL